MLIDESTEAHKPLTSDDDHMVVTEDERTPCPRKKESQMSNSEDEVGQDEFYQTPATLKRPKVPMLSISTDEDSSSLEMLASEDDGTDDEKENRTTVVKGKDTHKVIIEHMHVLPQLSISVVLL
jgi:hypothetical protein